MKRILFLVVASLAVVLAACTSTPAPVEETNDPPTNGQPNDPQTDPVETPANASLLDYFLPDGSSAHYKGEGNEFAELDITVARPSEEYVVIHENNGGSFIQKIYKLTANEIQVLSEEVMDLEVQIPTIAELDAMTSTRTYLKAPIEVGTTFGDWTIVEVGATVATPYQSFTDAIVIEQVDTDFINRMYITEDFGEVKREAIMSITGEPDFVVTSSLETVTP